MMKSKAASIVLDEETFKITEGVKRISGIIKSDKDYNSLRDMIITEKIDRFEIRDGSWKVGSMKKIEGQRS